MVEGTINSFPFRAALKPIGKGGHWLKVNTALPARCCRRGYGRHGSGGDYAGWRKTGDPDANGAVRSPESCPTGAGIVGGYHAHGAPELDSLDNYSKATGNAHTPDRERV